MGLSTYLSVLRRRGYIVLLCLIAGLAASAYRVHTTPRAYRAVSTIIVTFPSQGSASQDFNAQTLTSGNLKTYARLATTRQTAANVAQLTGLPLGAVAGHIAALNETDTFFIDVSGTSSDPGQARQIADTAAQVVSQRIDALQEGTSTNIHAEIQDRAALPGAPFKPNKTQELALGGLLGLLVGIGIVVLLEALDRSVRGVDLAQQLADAPLLALVPHRRGSQAARLVVADAVAEPYRTLRAAVRFLRPDAVPQVLLVTSSAPGEGKTTTAANLATAIGEAGQRVLLIDADMRRASLSRALGLSGKPGLSSVIARQADIDTVLHSTGTVTVLPSGPLPPNPSELLGSQVTAELIERLRAYAEVIVIDAPPVLVVSDAIALAPQCDVTMLVVRHGETTRASLAEASRRFAQVGSPVGGLVMNDVPRSESTGYYGDYVYGPVKRARFLRRRAA
ncbi:MAG TPA: polysaccharide biosynthesis tyrosine autokinase [Mycobacteriales bacterium]|nr:polysaccharide biosynthesis tyrosine autokinase [Mycobacteriales bacterium]